MEISIQKSNIPIVWLDTFFVIEYGKIVINRSEDVRYQFLYNILLEKVNQGKILCVRAEQEDELEGNIDISLKEFLKLTKGMRFKLSSEIKKIQLTRMMRTYFNKWSKFELLQSDARNDSLRLNEEVLLNVYSIPSEESINKKSKEKMDNIKELQAFKDSQDLSMQFNERLEDEFKGLYYATKMLIKKAPILKKMIDGVIPFEFKLYNQFDELVGKALQEWNDMTGESNDLEGYLEFLLSVEYKKIPFVDISAHLIADIMTSPKRWGLGDPMDISNLSAFLPYCDFMLTDKAQYNRLKRRKLDCKYKTKVYCTKNMDDLIQQISIL